MNAVDADRGRFPLLRRMVPVFVTGALAVGLAVGSWVSDELSSASHGWLPVFLILIQAIVLWMRRSRTELCLVLVGACEVAIAIASNGELSVGTVAVMFAAYTMWLRRPARTASAWLGSTAVILMVVVLASASSGSTIPAAWLIPFAVLRAVLAVGVPSAVAEFVLARTRLVGALRERAELAERDRERAGHEAVQQERALIARELHDIAAHHLSGIIVGVQAAGALTQSQPQQAREYLQAVSREAQLTLTNIRQTVGLLRVTPDGSLAPLPSIAQIPELVEAVRRRGTLVKFCTRGDASPFGPLAEITVYRMAQESLSNAERHAPGASCRVSVEYGDDALVVRVENDAPEMVPAPGESGYGLLGMRERADLVGGRLRCGPSPSGGWVNELRVDRPDPHLRAREPSADERTDT